MFKNRKNENMSEYDIQKLRAVLLYLLNKTGPIDIFHLFKILYFADREHMAKYGRRIMTDNFCAMENGPVPTILYDIIKSKTKKRFLHSYNNKYNDISDSFEPAKDDASYFINSDLIADASYLSTSDKECLDRSFDENINLSFSELKHKSHDDSWDEVWNKNGKRSNLMNPYSSAKAAGASEDMIEYMKEMDEIQSFMMS